jgi:hypothetical protein
LAAQGLAWLIRILWSETDDPEKPDMPLV